MKLPPAKERECRKRAMPGKTAAADGDAAGLLLWSAAGPGCEPVIAGMPFDDAPRHRGPGRMDGARAPPAIPA